MRILLVEDDPKIIEVLLFYLSQNAAYEVLACTSAEDAIEIIEEQSFGLILLDIMLPGMDGIALCERIRQRMYCPIIFISSLDDDETVIRALNMGGDDYIVKPFRGPVLLARVEANLRRIPVGGEPQRESMERGPFCMSQHDFKLQKNGAAIPLSPTEFELLWHFMQNENKVLQFSELYEHIWKMQSHNDIRTVFVHVRNLRKKIEEDPSQPVYLQTVRKMGYVFRAGIQ